MQILNQGAEEERAETARLVSRENISFLWRIWLTYFAWILYRSNTIFNSRKLFSLMFLSPKVILQSDSGLKLRFDKLCHTQLTLIEVVICSSSN